MPFTIDFAINSFGMNTSVASPKKPASDIPERRSGDKHPSRSLRKILLFCGILASVWYIAVNLIVPMQDKGYSSFSQTVSELSAIGAPTRQLWVALCIPFTLLEIAFGFGVFLSSGRNRRLRIAGALLIAYGLIGAFWPPMHQREVLAAGGKTLTDTMHIVFTAVTGLIMMVAMGFGAAALGRTFRLYSIATILVLLGFGAWTSSYASRLEANLPTPWMGVLERINIYTTMLWILVLAVLLLQRENKPATLTADTSV